MHNTLYGPLFKIYFRFIPAIIHYNIIISKKFKEFIISHSVLKSGIDGWLPKACG